MLDQLGGRLFLAGLLAPAPSKHPQSHPLRIVGHAQHIEGLLPFDGDGLGYFGAVSQLGDLVL